MLKWTIHAAWVLCEIWFLHVFKFSTSKARKWQAIVNNWSSCKLVIFALYI